MSGKAFFRALMLCVLLLVGVSAVRAERVGPVAGSEPPDITITVAWPGGSWSIDPTNPTAPGFQGATLDTQSGVWTLWGDWSGGAGAWRCIWNLEVNPDPFINAGFEFVNNLPGANNFSVSALLNTTVIAASPQMRGGISGTLVDASGGATLTTDTLNRSIYNAKIDGTVVRTLLDPFYSTSVPDGGVDNWGPPAPANFPFEPSAQVFSSIGMDHYFRLSGGGDRATLTSRFEVIPEPASLSLVLLGGLVFVRRRR